MSSLSYLVESMRVTFPTGKVAEKNPERVMTVTGKVWHAVENGKPTGDPLTITVKNIDRDDVQHPDFAIDPEAGTLTLPAGERGRKPSAGQSTDAILARIAAIRAGGEAEADAEAEVASK